MPIRRASPSVLFQSVNPVSADPAAPINPMHTAASAPSLLLVSYCDGLYRSDRFAGRCGHQAPARARIRARQCRKCRGVVRKESARSRLNRKTEYDQSSVPEICRAMLPTGLSVAAFNPEWQLVHGSTRGANGSTVGHAWLEFDGMVYDPVLDVEMTARDFAEQYAASTTAIYSVQEATRATIKFGHYGPWS